MCWRRVSKQWTKDGWLFACRLAHAVRQLFSLVVGVVGVVGVVVAVRSMISLGHLLIVYQINISIVTTAMQFSIPHKAQWKAHTYTQLLAHASTYVLTYLCIYGLNVLRLLSNTAYLKAFCKHLSPLPTCRAQLTVSLAFKLYTWIMYVSMKIWSKVI